MNTAVWTEALMPPGLTPSGWAGRIESEGASPTGMSEGSFDVRECLRRIREGSEEASEELIREIYPLVMRIVHHNRTRRDAPEDVAQEVFLKIFSKLESYRELAPFEHWVSRIAVNVCMNRLRAEKSRPELRWADLSEEEAQVLEAVTHGSESEASSEVCARELVERLLGALAPEDRLIIRMLEMEEFSVEEISARTGWSSTLIRVRAFRARRKLNKRFGALWRKGEL